MDTSFWMHKITEISFIISIKIYIYIFFQSIESDIFIHFFLRICTHGYQSYRHLSTSNLAHTSGIQRSWIQKQDIAIQQETRNCFAAEFFEFVQNGIPFG